MISNKINFSLLLKFLITFSMIFTQGFPLYAVDDQNMDQVISKIELYLKKSETITSFIDTLPLKGNDKLFLNKKIIENKIENHKMEIQVKKNEAFYTFLYKKNWQIIKINKADPRLIWVNGKKLDLEKVKDISQLYNEVQKCLASSKVSLLDFIIPSAKAAAAGWLVAAIIGTGILYSIVDDQLQKNALQDDINELNKMNPITCDESGRVTKIDIVTNPRTKHHPAINRVVSFSYRGEDSPPYTTVTGDCSLLDERYMDYCRYPLRTFKANLNSVLRKYFKNHDNVLNNIFFKDDIPTKVFCLKTEKVLDAIYEISQNQSRSIAIPIYSIDSMKGEIQLNPLYNNK